MGVKPAAQTTGKDAELPLTWRVLMAAGAVSYQSHTAADSRELSASDAARC